MLRILADTTSSLPPALAGQLGIAMLPQFVIFGDREYRDDTGLDTATFLKLLKGAASLPKTAAPPPTLYLPLFEEALRSGDQVLVVAPSAKISGTVRAAEAAAAEFPGAAIRVLDTGTLAGNLAALVLLAQRLAQAGESLEAVEARLKELIPCGRIYFLVDTLEYLYKGGRIGGAKALVGELLQVKPILQIKDGQAEPFDQERTRKRAVARLVEVAVEGVRGSPEPFLSVMEIDARAEAEALRDDLARATGIREIPIYGLPPAIAVHAGPRALSVGFFA